MPDLIYLLNSLVDKTGKILIDGIYDDVPPVTDDELKLYEHIDFDVNSYRDSIKAPKLAHNEDKTLLLQHRWRNPCLSIHGIEGAFAEPGQKTVIPGKVIGKMSLRIVPNQTPAKVDECVVKYLNKKWVERGSTNKMKVMMQQQIL